MAKPLEVQLKREVRPLKSWMIGRDSAEPSSATASGEQRGSLEVPELDVPLAAPHGAHPPRTQARQSWQWCAWEHRGEVGSVTCHMGTANNLTISSAIRSILFTH